MNENEEGKVKQEEDANSEAVQTLRGFPLSKITNEMRNANDVLCAAGTPSNKWPGNIQYRQIVDTRRAQYWGASIRGSKKPIAAEIVAQVRAMDPPGRFLKLDKQTKTWFDIGDEGRSGAVEKVCRLLRFTDLPAAKAMVASTTTTTSNKKDNMIANNAVTAATTIQLQSFPAIPDAPTTIIGGGGGTEGQSLSMLSSAASTLLTSNTAPPSFTLESVIPNSPNDENHRHDNSNGATAAIIFPPDSAIVTFDQSSSIISKSSKSNNNHSNSQEHQEATGDIFNQEEEQETPANVNAV